MKTDEQTAGDKNVMPSMVVRQQRLLMSNASGEPANSNSANLNSNASSNNSNNNNNNISSSNYNNNNYTRTDQLVSTSSIIKAACEQAACPSTSAPEIEFDDNGLILPKRLLSHPTVLKMQPNIIRDMNRELKFNQVRSKSVLDQKSELKRALEKFEQSKRKREAEQERLCRRTSLELRLEERAQQIAKADGSSTPASSPPDASREAAGRDASHCPPASKHYQIYH